MVSVIRYQCWLGCSQRIFYENGCFLAEALKYCTILGTIQLTENRNGIADSTVTYYTYYIIILYRVVPFYLTYPSCLYSNPIYYICLRFTSILHRWWFTPRLSLSHSIIIIFSHVCFHFFSKLFVPLLSLFWAYGRLETTNERHDKAPPGRILAKKLTLKATN